MQDGTYDDCSAADAELIESPTKKTPGVRFNVTNQHGEQMVGEVWLTDTTFARSVEALRHMGWIGDDLTDLATVGSRRFQIVVESEQRGNSWYPRIKWVNANGAGSGGGSGLVKMAPDAAKRFALAMRGQVIAASGGKSSTPPARAAGGAPVAPPARAAAQQREQPRPPPGYMPEPPPGQGDVDEDIPF